MSGRAGLGLPDCQRVARRVAGKDHDCVGWPRRVGLVAVLFVGGTVLGLVLPRGSSGHDAAIHGPVVAAPGVNSYPAAQVHGQLKLIGDCLLLGTSTVVWPSGSSWDAQNHAVMFSGDFDGAAPARVNAQFVGGGGYFSATDDYRSVFGEGAEKLADCMEETGASGVVFAYPSLRAAN